MAYTKAQHEIMAHEAVKALESLLANVEFKEAPMTYKNYVWAGLAMLQGKEPQNKIDNKMRDMLIKRKLKI